MRNSWRVASALVSIPDMPRVLWLRYNPNAHRIDGALQAVSKKEREAWLCSFLAGLELTEDLAIGYAYYDASGGACDVVADYPEWFRAVAGRLVSEFFSRLFFSARIR